MIDLHCHILPGFDDGAGTYDESCEMASIAAHDGVTAIVATPHCNIPNGFGNLSPEKFTESLRVLKEKLSGKENITLYEGAEVFGTDDLPEKLAEGKLITLNRTDYLLVEFGFADAPERVNRILRSVKTLGLTPVIAHPERYYFVNDNPRVAFRWAEEGYIIQQNKGSCIGRFGHVVRATSHFLLDNGLVGIVASDAHSPYSRTPRMTAAYEYVSVRYSVGTAERLFTKNPGLILQGKPILR